MKVSDPKPATSPNHDPTLLRALGRGLYWQHLLDAGIVADTAEIAAREGLHRVTVNDTLCFAQLAPSILAAALDGCLRRTFSLEKLQRYSIPMDWDAQHRLMMQPS
ncbi:site-specific recombinase resolvase [Aromatoleum evansii]|uniref:site-specific recombinase resolvase n=1 Tax=Aromatoleum evansii TaxID=59406 RepID=UPI00145D7C44|nr:site-specific recombinase resolvase [Aromatoleum evansii]NMG28407.1 site-specific recombinase resolvase [Aromatoleum evansii]